MTLLRGNILLAAALVVRPARLTPDDTKRHLKLAQMRWRRSAGGAANSRAPHAYARGGEGSDLEDEDE